jgi:hypothetical protein
MSGEKFMGTPAHVQKDKVEGNTDALSAKGRAGGKAAARKKAEKKAAQSVKEEMLALRRAQEREDSLRLNREAWDENIPPSTYN